MNDEERASLATLIARTREILDWVILDGGSKVPSYLRDPLGDAWTNITRERFRDLEETIASGTYDDELDQHGLSGLELRAKLVAFNAHYQAWSNLERRTRRRRFRRRPALPR
ncbi:MAG: hypothetical protein WA622_29860 [Mycobacterium sp.]|uniref:hypothetical protein n=1 Tax=Mycobacterium sp. TaxID=1785 RepID=UPI003C82BD4E